MSKNGKKPTPPCPLCGNAHKPLDRSKQYRMHGGDPDTSDQLRQVFNYATTFGRAGATSLEFKYRLNRVAVHSDFAALRAWAINTNQPFCIPFATPEGQTDTGCKVYRYFVYPHTQRPPVEHAGGVLALPF